jgi:hypothetical protein
MKRRETNFALQTATTGANVTFTQSNIPGPGVAMYHIEIVQGGGSALTTGNITRIRVKASGRPIVDITYTQLRSFLERISRANFAPGAAILRFTIPLCLFDADNDEQKFACQFPPGETPQLEIQLGAFAAVAGDGIRVTWTGTNQPANYSPMLIGVPLNFPASVPNQRYPITHPGLIRTVLLNTTGLDRARLTLAGQDHFNLSNAGLLEVDQLENPETITNPLAWTLFPAVPAPVGNSYLEADTAAAWAGVANEMVLWSFVPLV